MYITDNLCDTIYHYIAANKVLLNKNIIHHINVLTKLPRTRKIFHKKSQTIHLYCFNQYQKYLCKIFSLWTYPLRKMNDAII